jgi:hypothetical protein
MKVFRVCLVCLIVVFAGCASSGGSVDRPNTELFNLMDYLVRENDYLVVSYNTGKVLGDVTFEEQRDSVLGFNAWVGVVQQMTCLVTVKSGDEVVAQLFSADGKNDANREMADFRTRFSKVVLLDEPSSKKLIQAYNDMMNGD